MKRFMLLLYLLSKRLYKKASFVVILAFLVIITAVMCVAMKQESSMLKIAVVKAESSDSVDKIVKSLTSSESVVSYSLCSKQQAHSLLKNGKVDAVWEFADDFDNAMLQFIGGSTDTAPVKVTVREKNIFLNLTQERLYAELYPTVARQFYIDYANEKFDVENQNELMRFYDNVPRSGGIVEFSYYNDTEKVEDTNYLVTPLRGILAVILSLCTLASALYFLHDCDNGNMESIPLNKRWVLQLVYTLSGGLNIAFFVILALAVSGLMGNPFTEIFSMLLYVIASVGFATLVSGLAGKTVRMAAMLPMLMIGMLAVCPIFLNTNIKVISWIFPTYWYLNSVYNATVIIRMFIYIAVIYVLSYLVWKKRKYSR